jgi:hypothetical protein
MRSGVRTSATHKTGNLGYAILDKRDIAPIGAKEYAIPSPCTP